MINKHENDCCKQMQSICNILERAQATCDYGDQKPCCLGVFTIIQTPESLMFKYAFVHSQKAASHFMGDFNVNHFFMTFSLVTQLQIITKVGIDLVVAYSSEIWKKSTSNLLAK